MELPAGADSSVHLWLYRTRTRFILVQCDTARRCAWRFLQLSRVAEGGELFAVEDASVYTEREAASLLQTVAGTQGGATLVSGAVGCAGAIKFLSGFYLVLITSQRRVATVAGHAVFAVESTEIVELSAKAALSSAEKNDERRYARLLATMDLANDFYFAPSFPLTASLQSTALGTASSPWSSPHCWTAHLAAPFATCLEPAALSRWLTPLIHGFVGQLELAVGGGCSATLVARRSARFAGTRFRKRGVSDAGEAANEVEVEQTVDAGVWPQAKGTRGARPRPRCASVVQLRASIPLFWSQTASPLSPKPEILITRHDPAYGATRAHFDGLAARYAIPGDTCGAPVLVCLSLVKAEEKRQREGLLRKELRAAVDALNISARRRGDAAPPIALCGWDIASRAKKGRDGQAMRSLRRIVAASLSLTRVFCSPPPVGVAVSPSLVCARTTMGQAQGWAGAVSVARCVASVRAAWSATGAETVLGLDVEGNSEEADAEPPRDPFARGCLQRGVLRTNCIDCLDRTNVAQYAFGCEALGVQLLSLGLADAPRLPPDSPALAALSDLYSTMGDTLAQQYASSNAHHHAVGSASVERDAAAPLAAASEWRLPSSRDLFTSVRRFYSASVTDREKQDVISLFLGSFVPARGSPAVWELPDEGWTQPRPQPRQPRRPGVGGGARPPEDWADRDGAWDAWRPPSAWAACDQDAGLVSFAASTGGDDAPSTVPVRLYGASLGRGGYTLSSGAAHQSAGCTPMPSPRRRVCATAPPLTAVYAAHALLPQPGGEAAAAILAAAVAAHAGAWADACGPLRGAQIPCSDAAADATSLATIRERDAAAREEFAVFALAATELGQLRPGVLRAAPPASTSHAMARHAMEQAAASPLIYDARLTSIADEPSTIDIVEMNENF